MGVTVSLCDSQSATRARAMLAWHSGPAMAAETFTVSMGIPARYGLLRRPAWRSRLHVLWGDKMKTIVFESEKS
jgi:hypothetical protein